MQHPSTPASIAPVHSVGAPGSARAFLLGCSLALVWFVLLILQILAEPRLDILQTAEDLGQSAGWCELLLGSLLFALMLGLTLRLLPRFQKARPLAWLLAGWVGGGATLCQLFVIWFYKYGVIGPVGAG